MFKHFDICVTILLIDIFYVCWMYISDSPSPVLLTPCFLCDSDTQFYCKFGFQHPIYHFVCLFVEWSSWFLCLIRSENELCWYGILCRISVTQNLLTGGISITLQLLSLCGNESCLENCWVILGRWLSMKICIILPHMIARCCTRNDAVSWCHA